MCCVCNQWMTVWLTDPHFSAEVFYHADGAAGELKAFSDLSLCVFVCWDECVASYRVLQRIT